MAADPGEFLKPPSDGDISAVSRIPSSYNPRHAFDLPKGEQKHYTQQYADMYFLRLAMLKPVVERIAGEAWEDFELAGERARKVDKVLDVRQGQLCWVVGTVYMDMPLKPNVLDDISKEHWIAAPPRREKYTSAEGEDQVMLEDESGRLLLTGPYLKSYMLCTGCIVAVIGTENKDSAFEVIDIQIPDLPRQPQRWEREDGVLAVSGKPPKRERPKAGKIALLSGLSLTGVDGDELVVDLLTEYLLGEASSQQEAAQISRLIIAGNSLSQSSPIPSREEQTAKKPNKKYGYDASAYNPHPTEQLDAFLATLLPSLPVTIMPGASDPAPVAIPQQPLHAALFPRSRNYGTPPNQPGGVTEVGWFDSVTNPWEGDVEGWRVMGNAGQPIDDMYKYVEGESRIEMIENLLRWRNGAPTAPDTLWSYPFQEEDPFIMKECPRLYFVGNQPRFETAVIEGPAGQTVRLIAVPKFKETGVLVLVDAESMEVECVQFGVNQTL